MTVRMFCAITLSDRTPVSALNVSVTMNSPVPWSACLIALCEMVESSLSSFPLLSSPTINLRAPLAWIAQHHVTALNLGQGERRLYERC